MTRHSYGPHSSQYGELHLPARSRPPVVCLFHGGFWRMPYGAEQLTPLAEDLARRGYAAWNLEYRRLGDGGGWPATFEDAAAGVDHLAALSAEGAGLDLARVATVGHSAGGHLALWAAARPRLPAGAPGANPRVRVIAACGQAPVPDLARAHALALGGGVAASLLGGDPAAHPDRLAAGSPHALLPLSVPQLLVHGADDEDVPVAMSRDYAAAARAAGDPVELVEPPGIGHFDHLDPDGEAWRVVTDWLAHRMKA